MPGIKQPILDIMARLATVAAPTTDNPAQMLYVRIWNNQIKEEKTGNDYAYPLPAAFVEIINDATYDLIGQGLLSGDLGVRIHLEHEFYNNEGTFEQDLPIFDLRDTVLSLLMAADASGWKPTNCTPLVKVKEEQDYQHSNIYHYIIDFVCNFIDTSAQTQYAQTTPPTAVEIDATLDISGASDNAEQNINFLIPQHR